jgi:NAD(P)-dependent dehydrogenase (short-subunit alcohol dehydrogenase family)
LLLPGKIAVLTGGSGGIGTAIAKRLLAEGAKVAVADVACEPLISMTQELSARGRLKAYVVDVSKIDDVLSLKKGALEEYGRVDILINAAGIQGPIGAFLENDLKEWLRNIQINLLGTVICCQVFGTVFRDNKAGKIVNFAGGGANTLRPYFSAYGAAKAAVVRFTETLAEELRPFGIQANAVSPGVIRTQMIEETLRAGLEKAGPEYHQLRAREVSGFDDPGNVAELVCYLASDSSNWLTGRNISAVWDPWREWAARAPKGLDKDLYVLRRIDGRNFKKA